MTILKEESIHDFSNDAILHKNQYTSCVRMPLVTAINYESECIDK